MLSAPKKISSIEKSGSYFAISANNIAHNLESGIAPEEIGLWHGKGAQYLGLDEIVTRQDYISIMNGSLPNGIQLGMIRDGINVHDAGREFVFSAPKSVSIAALIYDDKRLLDAHRMSVKETLNVIESEYMATRVKEGGKVELRATNNLIAATFEQYDSREGDPQLHTHCIIANATNANSG